MKSNRRLNQAREDQAGQAAAAPAYLIFLAGLFHQMPHQQVYQHLMLQNVPNQIAALPAPAEPAQPQADHEPAAPRLGR